LGIFCIVSFTFVTIFIYMMGTNISIETGVKRQNRIVSKFIVHLLPRNIPTHIPSIPQDEDIDWNWRNYMDHVNHTNYTLTFQMNPGGLAVRIRCMIGTLFQAMHVNRSFLLDYIDMSYNIGQSIGSSYGNWTQFFCPVHSAQYLPQVTPKDAELVKQDPFTVYNSPHIYASVGHCPGEWLQDSTSENMHEAGIRLWRFNPKTRTELELILSIFPNWSERRYHAIHIRRGDKIVGRYKEAEYVATENYCTALENLVGGNVTDPVFVAADSEQSINEIRVARPEWEVWSIPAPHLRSENYSTEIFNQRPLEFRMEFSYLFYAELTMFRYAYYFICTKTSNISSLMSILRHPNLPKINSVDKKKRIVR